MTDLSDLPPPERARRYRALEAEVSRLAEQSQGDIRTGFLSIARSWAQLAEELEAEIAAQASKAADQTTTAVFEQKEAALRPPKPEKDA